MARNPKSKGPINDPSASPHGGKPAPTHDVAAEQAREAQEKAKAQNAEASIREHMVNIGRGNQQAGRQGQ